MGASGNEVGEALVWVGSVGVGDSNQFGGCRSNARFQSRAVPTVAGVLDNLKIVQWRNFAQDLFGVIRRAVIDDDNTGARSVRNHRTEFLDRALDGFHLVVAGNDHSKV